MKNKISRIFGFSILLIFSMNCTNSKEIEIEELAKIYVDLLVVEDYYLDTDSIEVKKKEVFSKYSVDTASYYESFRLIKTDIEKWEKFFNLSNTYLDTLKANLKNTSLPQ